MPHHAVASPPPNDLHEAQWAYGCHGFILSVAQHVLTFFGCSSNAAFKHIANFWQAARHQAGDDGLLQFTSSHSCSAANLPGEGNWCSALITNTSSFIVVAMSYTSLLQ
jgi:hypothetical protein